MTDATSKPARHHEPAPPATDPAAFRAVVEGRRSVRKFSLFSTSSM